MQVPAGINLLLQYEYAFLWKKAARYVILLPYF